MLRSLFPFLLLAALGCSLLVNPMTPSRGDVRSDGATRLTAPSGDKSDQNPAFSPEEDVLLFTRFENGYNRGPSSLQLLDLETGSVRSLVSAADCDHVNLPGSSWNRVTNRIVFSSDREDIDEIWTMAEDGSGLFRVTFHDPPAYFIEPSYSPDGEWIAFEGNFYSPDGGSQWGSIWKVRADGTELTRLTGGASDSADDRQPNWSPTGNRILFQRRQAGGDDWNLFTMNPDGSKLYQVTASPSADTDASWSPNGEWIVYSSDYGNLSAPNIFVISAKGGAPLRVTHDEQNEDGAPSWSSDGTRIAFESRISRAEDAPSCLWWIAAPLLETKFSLPAMTLRIDVGRLGGASMMRIGSSSCPCLPCQAEEETNNLLYRLLVFPPQWCC